jgi:hypothetical protein
MFIPENTLSASLGTRRTALALNSAFFALASFRRRRDPHDVVVSAAHPN